MQLGSSFALLCALAGAAAAGAALGCSSDDVAAPNAAPAASATASQDGSVPPLAPTDAAAPLAAEASTPAAAALEPVLFIHGINPTGSDFDVMVARLEALGWKKDLLFVKTFPDPQWGCNVDNANLIVKWVDEIVAKTGSPRVDLVAHSMGGLSSRRYMKLLGGAARVGTYVTLGTMHHGLPEPCLNPLPVCVWKELCQAGEYIAALDVAPITPGPARWVSIFSPDDGTVSAASSKLAGAENIELPGIPHSGPGGLLESDVSIGEVARVLK